MSLFNKKTKLGIDQCCTQLYKSDIFIDNSILSVVPSLSLVDQELLQREFTAFRMELFAQAFYNRFKKDKACIEQSIFTRRYLVENNMLRVWEIMAEYNKIIAESAFLNEKGEQYSGAMGRATMVGIQGTKFNLIKEWMKEVDDDNQLDKDDKANMNLCIGRAINRLSTNIYQNNNIASRLLLVTLLNRIGYLKLLDLEKPNKADEIRANFMGMLTGFYDGANNLLKSIDIN